MSGCGRVRVAGVCALGWAGCVVRKGRGGTADALPSSTRLTIRPSITELTADPTYIRRIEKMRSRTAVGTMSPKPRVVTTVMV